MLYGRIECFVFGRRSKGYFDIRKLSGEIIHKSANYKKIKLLESSRTILTERSGCHSSTVTKVP